MQSWARGLKKRLLPANRSMQSAGAVYHKKLLELQELTHVQEALAAAHQVCAWAESRIKCSPDSRPWFEAPRSLVLVTCTPSRISQDTAAACTCTLRQCSDITHFSGRR